MKNNKSGLFVVSAPSGSGKSTLCKIVINRNKNICNSVSYTTRRPRAGETNGEDYYFVSEEVFKNMIAEKEFIEWALIFNNYYGTAKKSLEKQLEMNKKVIFEIDVLGAEVLKKHFPKSVLIFITPPTLDTLKTRLLNRGSETEETLTLRLSRIAEEVAQRNIYNFLLVNDNMQQAAEKLEDIILYNKGTLIEEAEDFWPKFFKNYPDLNWN